MFSFCNDKPNHPKKDAIILEGSISPTPNNEVSIGQLWDFDGRKTSVNPLKIQKNTILEYDDCYFTSISTMSEKINHLLVSGKMENFSSNSQQQGMLFECSHLRLQNNQKYEIYYHKSSVLGFSVSSCFCPAAKAGISILCNKGLMSDIITRVTLWGLECLIEIALGIHYLKKERRKSKEEEREMKS